MDVYTLMKRIIERGDYDKVEMTKKLGVYLQVGRITQEQFDEIVELMG